MKQHGLSAEFSRADWTTSAKKLILCVFAAVVIFVVFSSGPSSQSKPSDNQSGTGVRHSTSQPNSSLPDGTSNAERSCLRIIAVCDLHFSNSRKSRLRPLPTFHDGTPTALILCGDLIDDPRATPHDVVETYKMQNNDIASAIVIPGNMDSSWGADDGKHSGSIWSEALGVDTHYLLHNHTVLKMAHSQPGSFSVFGSPWTPKFVGMFQGDPPAHGWDEIPSGTDVLVTHGPPYGILDLTSGGAHVGDVHLKDTLAKNPGKRPKVSIFGHIHHSGGQATTKDGTLFINAAQHWNVIDVSCGTGWNISLASSTSIFV